MRGWRGVLGMRARQMPTQACRCCGQRATLTSRLLCLLAALSHPPMPCDPHPALLPPANNDKTTSHRLQQRETRQHAQATREQQKRDRLRLTDGGSNLFHSPLTLPSQPRPTRAMFRATRTLRAAGTACNATAEGGRFRLRTAPAHCRCAALLLPLCDSHCSFSLPVSLAGKPYGEGLLVAESGRDRRHSADWTATPAGSDREPADGAQDGV